MSVGDLAIEPFAPALEVGPAEPGRGRSLLRRHVALLGLGSVLALAVAWTFLPPLLVALDAARHGRVFLGATGIWPMDQLQYLAWLRDAGAHGLISNLYGLGGRAVFIHPLFTPFGLLEAGTGLSPVVTMLLLQLLSLGVLACGCIRFVRTRLSTAGPGRRVAALALCLFGGLTPLAVTLPVMDPWNGWLRYNDAAGALLNATALWAYAPLAVSIGLMPYALEGIELVVAGRADRRIALRTAALGLLIAWLHPWQGEELLIIAGGLLVWSLRSAGRRAPLRGLLAPAAAIAAPLLYYMLLSHIDVGWRTSAQASVAGSLIPWSVVVTCVAPLFLVVLISLPRVPLGERSRILVLWPAACLLTILLTPNGQYRALAGATLPMAVLAVGAWPRLAGARRRWLAAAAGMLVALGPSVPYLVQNLTRLDDGTNTAYTEPAPSDIRAASLAARLSDGRPILAPVAFGTAIPALTDARVWVGHPIWTPDHQQRDAAVFRLFGGWLKPPYARRLVLSTGTRVLVEPCSSTRSLAAELAPIGFRETRVGCARVYAR